uniref:NADH dehydrogenase [ubiquinone] 1 beta subcomplex subunit 5, mitochondrial n=1 Tax=Pogona vitticeps TaxID=103695 RepID=A0A6J0U265_9SAUR|nr:NADH dehydrogenase [ubiquinone] 1 beta subcomplex subunit 5, mitochondrial [Pogona vitticeps]
MAAMSLLLRAGASFGTRRGLLGCALRGRFPLAGLTVGRPVVLASVRHSSGEKRLFYVIPQRFYDRRFMASLWFYMFLTGIPIIIFITLVNIFIGDAELVEIPEGYYPDHWEYYKHPITRWIARYLLDPPEKDYEKTMALLHLEKEKMKLRQDMRTAQRMMFNKGDGPWYFYATPSTKQIDYSNKATPDN